MLLFYKKKKVSLLLLRFFCAVFILIFKTALAHIYQNHTCSWIHILKKTASTTFKIIPRSMWDNSAGWQEDYGSWFALFLNGNFGREKNRSDIIHYFVSDVKAQCMQWFQLWTKPADRGSLKSYTQEQKSHSTQHAKHHQLHLWH